MCVGKTVTFMELSKAVFEVSDMFYYLLCLLNDSFINGDLDNTDVSSL